MTPDLSAGAKRGQLHAGVSATSQIAVVNMDRLRQGDDLRVGRDRLGDRDRAVYPASAADGYRDAVSPVDSGGTQGGGRRLTHQGDHPQAARVFDPLFLQDQLTLKPLAHRD